LVVVRCESGGGDGVEGKIGGGGTTEDGEAENGGGSFLDRLKQGIGGGLSRITTTTRVVPTAIPTPSNNGWPLPSPHTILQTSLYNYIRTTLRHAPMHPTTTGSSAFYEVMDLWLLWMEPWNVVHKTRCGGSSPPSSTSTKAAKEFVHNVSEYVHSKSSPSSSTDRTQRQPSKASWKPPNTSTAPSKYTTQWEPYVAANLHFYTVPLAIFLRRARELDFENRFHASITYIQRVLRVYVFPPTCFVVGCIVATVRSG